MARKETDVVVSIENIVKAYGTVKAVKGITLSVPVGSFYAIIGPNGAGKSTLMKMVVGLLRQDAGRIRIFGHDTLTNPTATKSILSYISDDPTPYEYLTGIEFVSLTARLRGISREQKTEVMHRYTKMFDIAEVMKQPISGYSRGSRQKIAFIAAMVGSPKLLVIDEPIVGLDPTSIEVFGTELQRFCHEGGTVLLSTHILSFASRFARKVGVLYDGKLAAEKDITEKTDLERVYELAVRR